MILKVKLKEFMFTGYWSRSWVDSNDICTVGKRIMRYKCFYFIKKKMFDVVKY